MSNGKFEHFLCVDLETYFDREFSLKKMSTPEYILSRRFQVHLMAAYDIAWNAPKIVLPHEIPAFLTQYPAEKTVCCSFNALFDLSILAWKYGWVAGRLQDALGMTRALRTYQKYNLGAVLEQLFGFNSKGDVIYKCSGLDVQGIKNAGLWPEYCTYAMGDVRACANIYFKLLSEFPVEERQIMDLVLRAAIQPVLRADTELLQTHLDALRRHKAALLRDCGYDKAALMSSNQFQHALEDLGVEIETKPGAKGPIPAFAKTDSFMQGLLEYDKGCFEENNLKVQALAAARLSFKSTIEETRVERFINVAQQSWPNNLPMMPAPLRYGGAHTHRLSGEWGMNLQNLPRDKSKSKLRQALVAPDNHLLVAADLSQIEARLVAVLCQQNALVAAFRKGEDVYASFASIVFGRTINKKDQPNERFIGKTSILGLGYGCGVERFYQMVISQARQYQINLEGLFTTRMAEIIVNTYRSLFFNIPMNWHILDQHYRTVINSPNQGVQAQWGPVLLKSCKIILPNRMTLRYKLNDERLWGGFLLENITQALARIVIMQVALRLAKRGLRFVLQAHDELVFAIPKQQVEEAKKTIMEEMLRPPAWLPELPLAAEIGVGFNYGDTKT
jgi:hypothetical protein